MIWCSFIRASTMRAYKWSWSWPSCNEDRALWLTDYSFEKSQNRSMLSIRLYYFYFVSIDCLWYETGLSTWEQCVHIHGFELDPHAVEIDFMDWLIALLKSYFILCFPSVSIALMFNVTFTYDMKWCIYVSTMLAYASLWTWLSYNEDRALWLTDCSLWKKLTSF